jgi:hypothetical protein
MNDAIRTHRSLVLASDELFGDMAYRAARGAGLTESQASIYAEAREDDQSAQDALRIALRVGR